MQEIITLTITMIMIIMMMTVIVQGQGRKFTACDVDETMQFNYHRQSRRGYEFRAPSMLTLVVKLADKWVV
jgi:hypothetical protein